MLTRGAQDGCVQAPCTPFLLSPFELLALDPISEWEGQWRETFLIAPGDPASRPGALNNSASLSPARMLVAGREAGVASGSCTREAEALSGALKACLP